MIDTALATRLARQWINPRLNVTAVERLHGGMIHQTCQWITDGEPAAIVAKVNRLDRVETLRREAAGLTWYRRHTQLPVPEPYACAEVPEAGLGVLMLEKIHGTTLDQARLSQRGQRHFQQELARHVAALHHHHRDQFGSPLAQESYPRWLDAFAPMFHRHFEAVRDQLSTRSRQIIEHTLAHLERWLPPQAKPTLIHGDLWATNILVDDSHPHQPRIMAFIDGAPTYSDPEYELAYLRLFNTADSTFFAAYAREHPIHPGFEQRCRIYWLATMLLHVQQFGPRCVPACESLAEQIRQMAG